MTTRRDHRQTHVRPRPPSSGRSAPIKVKPRSPGPNRLASHRPIQRSNGLPIIVRIALAAAMAALGVAVLILAVGGLGKVAGGIGSTLSGFVSSVTSTPVPSLGALVPPDAPSIEQPAEPYTSEKTADLAVTVPAELRGKAAYRLKVYLTLPDQQPSAIQDAPVGDGPTTIIPVELTKGVNDFTVAVLGPGGESDKSLSVRYVYDASPPKMTVTSPKNNATVNGKAVTIKGKTQARTTLLARNDANGSTIAATAAADGTFSLSLALSSGVNKITITGTDPAGNVASTTINVRRGNGKLTVRLNASIYRIKRSHLPEPVTLTATVTDPDGKPLAGAVVTFTLSMPGIPTVSIDTKTSASGKATFRTTVPKGADVGQGSATVLVSTDALGSTQDFTVITITK
jgi:hypothetical protein